ncbi:hypothetical protein BH18VER1_BH18VER1_16540 [soil metagenome]
MPPSSHADWARRRLSVRRQKTGALFFVPIYAHLERRRRRMRRRSENGFLFTIKDAKKSLRAACLRLGYPQFSQRSLRQFLIGQLWKAGVDPKLIANGRGIRTEGG